MYIYFIVGFIIIVTFTTGILVNANNDCKSI